MGSPPLLPRPKDYVSKDRTLTSYPRSFCKGIRERREGNLEPPRFQISTFHTKDNLLSFLYNPD